MAKETSGDKRIKKISEQVEELKTEKNNLEVELKELERKRSLLEKNLLELKEREDEALNNPDSLLQKLIVEAKQDAATEIKKTKEELLAKEEELGSKEQGLAKRENAILEKESALEAQKEQNSKIIARDRASADEYISSKITEGDKYYANKKADADKLHAVAKNEKDGIDKECAEKRSLADEYVSNKKVEGNNYFSTKKTEADEYCENKKKEANTIYTEANSLKESVEKECKDKKSALEKYDNELQKKNLGLVDIENRQAEEKRNLDIQKENAINGFQLELNKETEKYYSRIATLTDEIAKLEQDKNDRVIQINNEMCEYKEKSYKAIGEEISKAKAEQERLVNELNKTKDEYNKKLLEVEEKERQLKDTKSFYETKSKGLDDVVNEKVEELYGDILNSKNQYHEMLKKARSDNNSLKETIRGLQEKLDDAKGEDVNVLNQQIENLKKQLEDATKPRNDVFAKLNEIGTDSASLEENIYKINNYDKLASDYSALLEDKKQIERELEKERHDSEAIANAKNMANEYKDSCDKAYEELRKIRNPDRKNRLSGFTGVPEFDKVANLNPFSKNYGELIWLDNIKTKMDEAQIIISKRLLYAFHTSVKIHDWSPLVVLAGVSGTGKSELPKHYAYHGGMNFISIPVKPDWDSMDSLFGYYNSIEHKYQPTELLKAIYYVSKSGDVVKGTMLLVLLDEMNLAHIELYFSDLLSKFETNRDLKGRVPAYEINLGSDVEPESVNIGKNILWVGTMNEDETTKALSDKVVDRSTLLTFPRPTTLESRRNNPDIGERTYKLPYTVWEEWCKNCLSEENLKGKINIDDYRHIVERINDEMSRVNRNLGHRVWQSIEKYVFSHPAVFEASTKSVQEFKEQFDLAFAEAVAFKVMPKLRGIEVSGESKKVLEAIQTIINQDVSSLQEDFAHAMGLSSRIFQWSSAEFIMKDVKGNK